MICTSKKAVCSLLNAILFTFEPLPCTINLWQPVCPKKLVISNSLEKCEASPPYAI